MASVPKREEGLMREDACDRASRRLGRTAELVLVLFFTIFCVSSWL